MVFLVFKMVLQVKMAVFELAFVYFVTALSHFVAAADIAVSLMTLVLNPLPYLALVK